MLLHFSGKQTGERQRNNEFNSQSCGMLSGVERLTCRWLLASVLAVMCAGGMAGSDCLADSAETDSVAVRPTAEQIEAANEELSELADTLTERTARQRLIALDDEWASFTGTAAAQVRTRALQLLAESEDEDAVQYIRSVYESQIEARDLAAAALAIAAQRSPTNLQDWRWLISALTVVEDEQAVAVMQALQRFRQRATNSRWIRRVILIGLKLPPEQQQVAVDLLGHWTSLKTSRPKEHAQADLAFYQNWFHEKWPQEQPADWPEEPAEARWKFATLRNKLTETDFSEAQIEQGRTVYEKAGCANCHIKGKIGKPFGPELSEIATFRQRKELLEAIVFPSLELHEDYPSVTVVTKQGKVHSGLMTAGEEGEIKLVNPRGEIQSIARTEIDQMQPLQVSNMPAGALEPLTEAEILALFAFLELRENPTKPYHQPE